MAADADTMWALTFDRRRESWDGSTGMVKERVPRPVLDPDDRDHVLVRIRYAGFCGSDRGIWSRRSFGDLVTGSLADTGTDRRIFGHEMFGVVEAIHPDTAAETGLSVGDPVSAESHVTCGTCASCVAGLHHVCLEERILGISVDGVFAEVAKLPAKVLWKTDTTAIRPEVAATQEPFGNAVHACSVADLADRTVVIIGTGTIGLFAVQIARGLGATRVIGVEPDPANADRARRLGADPVLPPSGGGGVDRAVVDRVHALTDGVGADVVLEMSGVPASVDTALHAVKPGGDVVLFGVRNGDLTLTDFHRVVMRGLNLHGVVGRRIWETWHTTRALLSDPATGVQQSVWDHVLDRGEGTIVDIDDWSREAFEQTFHTHPKVLIRFSRAEA